MLVRIIWIEKENEWRRPCFLLGPDEFEALTKIKTFHVAFRMRKPQNRFRRIFRKNEAQGSEYDKDWIKFR